MEKKIEFTALSNLKSWLISATGICITSVALMQDIETIEMSVVSPKIFYYAIEHMPGFIPDGRYIVSYKDDLYSEDKELDYSKMVFALAVSVTLRKSGLDTEGVEQLDNALADYEIMRINNKESNIVSYWVVEPANPTELQLLTSTLEKLAVLYAFNDGTGTFNLSNTKFGNGVYAGLTKPR